MKTEEKTKLTSKELLELLKELNKEETYQTEAKFTREEAQLIADLVLRKDSEKIFYRIVDFIVHKHFRSISLKGSWARRLRFLYHYSKTFNAKEAAIRSGFSPHTARQQGWRIKKQLQGYKRKIVNGKEELVKER